MRHKTILGWQKQPAGSGDFGDLFLPIQDASVLADGAGDFAAVDRLAFCMKLLIKLKNG